MKFFHYLSLLILTATLASAAETSLTIYSSKFGVVRETLPLDLQKGENEIRMTNVTNQLDPGSIILRDPAGKIPLRILEQKFRSEVLSQDDMLAQFEGASVPFRVREGDHVREVQGKIIRAQVVQRNGGREAMTIVEVNGRYEFGLPGTPIFPKLLEGASLKPELIWKIVAEQPTKLEAELVYITDGFNWSADYDAVVSENGDISQLTGWITVKNDTARTFEKATVKVVAGQVNRVTLDYSGTATTDRVIVTGSYIPTGATSENESAPMVLRKNFDEYHEYALQRPVTLEGGETTQVEFVKASAIKAMRSYVYSGFEPELDTERLDRPNLNAQFGIDSNTKVVVLSEFKNDEANHLGMPLPQGRFHFYRDIERQLQFTGESAISNIPANEMVRAVSGNAFDLVGERHQNNFRVSADEKSVEESFEIKLRNHRKDAVEIRVVEHPSRWREWEIIKKSDEFKKIDGRTIEFRVPVKAGEEKILTYTIRYSHLPVPKN